jgi:hypothetical protein
MAYYGSAVGEVPFLTRKWLFLRERLCHNRHIAYPWGYSDRIYDGHFVSCLDPTRRLLTGAHSMATITSAQIYDARYDLPDGAGTATPFHPLRSDPKAASRPSRQK